MQPSRDLSGDWRAIPADDDLRRTYPDADFDDTDWPTAPVPGHWRSVPALAGEDGPILYRRRFDGPGTEEPAGRWWLVLDGVFYTSDVWLDGAYVGDTEGYFFPHRFEVTELMAARSEHVLGLEVACAPQVERRRKRNLTGVFQHWDLLDQDWNPGGIWRPVRLERTGTVQIRHQRVLCRDAQPETAQIFVRAVLDTPESLNVTVRTTVTDPSGAEVVELEREQPLAAGENRLEWTVTVPDPQLWWPWSLGDQPLYQVETAVLIGDEVSDRRNRPIGLRRVDLRNWIMSVNGERLFVKGSNQGPNRMALGEAPPELFADDVQLARDAGLDLLRVHAHVGRRELYDAADRLGMMLWQDLPLQWGYARGVRAQARRQAREAVDLLAHHPSVVVWCGHNEPLAIDVEPAALSDPRRRARLVARAAAGQFLPSWNRSVLDHSIAAVLEKTDGSRPVIAHSGILPHPPQFDGTDSHTYFGWYVGEQRDFGRLLRWWPRLARFVSEFGAQAVPVDASFLEPQRWPDLDWERAARTHALQKPFFDRYVPPERYDTFDEWRTATQAYQAELIARHIETLRRIKYRPCGGFAQFSFADGYPSVTWSVLGHDRQPKAGYDALRRACAPVIVVSDQLPPDLHPGEPLRVQIHAVSDRRISLDDMLCSADLYWRQDGQDRTLGWAWRGAVPADGCALVGTIDTLAPPADDDIELRLTLSSGADQSVVATNRYVARAAAATRGRAALDLGPSASP
jgi:beta-mannosidase